MLALAAGVLAAGCGSSSNSASTGNTTTTAAAPTPAAGATTSTAASTPTSTATAPALQEPPEHKSVAACKRGIQSQTTISARLKGKLEEVCEKAGTGGPELHKLTQEVCVDLAEAAHLPASVTRERIAACEAK